MSSSTLFEKSKNSGFRLIVLSVAALILSACGSSTKIYNNDKTIVYRDSLYNLSTVKQVGTEITGKLADDSMVDLTRADKKKVQSLLNENKSMFVTMKFDLDGNPLVYRAKSITKYREFSRMKSDFDSAKKKIVNLMGDKKKMQLKLK